MKHQINDNIREMKMLILKTKAQFKEYAQAQTGIRKPVNDYYEIDTAFMTAIEKLLVLESWLDKYFK